MDMHNKKALKPILKHYLCDIFYLLKSPTSKRMSRMGNKSLRQITDASRLKHMR